MEPAPPWPARGRIPARIATAASDVPLGEIAAAERVQVHDLILGRRQPASFAHLLEFS